MTVRSAGPFIGAMRTDPEGCWVAEVDGQPVDVFPVDIALRGVVVPAGEHVVVVRTADTPLRRTITVKQGIDPREYSLVAFGGGGAAGGLGAAGTAPPCSRTIRRV